MKKIFFRFRQKSIFIRFSMKMLDKIFQNFRSQKFSSMDFHFVLKIFPVKLFGRFFFKIALDFHGGLDGSGFRGAGQVYPSCSPTFLPHSPLFFFFSTNVHWLSPAWKCSSHVARFTEMVRYTRLGWREWRKKNSGHNSDFTASIPATASIEGHHTVPEEKIRGHSSN